MILSRRITALEQLFEDRDIVQEQMESCLSDPKVNLLDYVPGVGQQTAVQYMSMIVDIGRFEDSRSSAPTSDSCRGYATRAGRNTTEG